MRMGGAKGTGGAELLRPPGFVWSLGWGRCFHLRGGIWCRRLAQGTPKSPLLGVAGLSDANEGRPLCHHYIPGVGRRRAALPKKEGQERKWGVYLAPAAESSGGATGRGGPTNSVGSGMG